MFPQEIMFWHTKKIPLPAAWLEAVKKALDTGMKSAVFQRNLGEGHWTYSYNLECAMITSTDCWPAPGRFYHFWWQHEGGHKGVRLISSTCNSLEVQTARREHQSSRLPWYSAKSEQSLQRGTHPFLHGYLGQKGWITPEGALSLQSPPATAEGPQTTTINLMPVTSQMRRIPPEIILSKQCQCHLRMTPSSPLFHHVLCLSALLVYIIRQRKC